ncbi:MAG: AraC family transcriptional regulator [Paenibacillus sp.]|jgi:AraC-like DNA-binding protein|nr:AraC family transcriptional regulator [Paenibacillus sp.]
MQIAFDTTEDLSNAVDELFHHFPALLYYHLDSVAPFPGIQSHNGIEMYYIEAGFGNYLVGDQVYPLKPGTLMIIRPYTLHKVLQTDVDPIICRNVLMWKEAFIKDSWNEPLPYPLDDLPGDSCRVQFPPELQGRITNLYSSIHHELTRRNRGYEAVVHCLIKELLLLTYRQFHEEDKENRLQSHNDLPEEISFLVQYIGSNFHHDISLKELGRLVHLNPSYLSSAFHKYAGLTIMKFIAVKRLHHAKKLLRETKLSVTEIAYLSGFNSHSYFISMFKKTENQTPASYRRQYNRT